MDRRETCRNHWTSLDAATFVTVAASYPSSTNRVENLVQP